MILNAHICKCSVVLLMCLVYLYWSNRSHDTVALFWSQKVTSAVARGNFCVGYLLWCLGWLICIERSIWVIVIWGTLAVCSSSCLSVHAEVFYLLLSSVLDVYICYRLFHLEDLNLMWYDYNEANDQQYLIEWAAVCLNSAWCPILTT